MAFIPGSGRGGSSGRGLHSSTFRLNVTAFCGRGVTFSGLFRGCLGGVRGCKGVCRVI